MDISTVNISFQKKLLVWIDKVAAEESRSRSELLREAARQYIEKKEKWKKIFTYGEMKAAALGVAEKDVAAAVGTYRLRRGKTCDA